MAKSETNNVNLKQYEAALNNIASRFTGRECNNTEIFKLKFELDIVRCSAKQNNIDISKFFPIIVDCGEFELKYDSSGNVYKTMKAPMERIEFEVTI